MHRRQQPPQDGVRIWTLILLETFWMAEVKKIEKIGLVEQLSVWTLAYCEWRAAAPGLKPLRLPRAPHWQMGKSFVVRTNTQERASHDATPAFEGTRSVERQVCIVTHQVLFTANPQHARPRPKRLAAKGNEKGRGSCRLVGRLK